MANEVKIVISADSDKAVGALKQVTDQVTSMSTAYAFAAGKIAAVGAAVSTLTGVYSTFSDVLKKAGQKQEQFQYLDLLASRYGQTATSIIKDLERLTGGLSKTSDLIKIANTNMMAGLDPEKLRSMAGAAETVADVAGIDVTQAFQAMAEAAKTGRERTMEQIVGVIDLEDRFGKLTSTMSETEKANERYKIMMERLKPVQDAMGEGVDSYGKKLERLEIQIGKIPGKIAEASVGLVDWLSGAASSVANTILAIMTQFVALAFQLAAKAQDAIRASGLEAVMKKFGYGLDPSVGETAGVLKLQAGKYWDMATGNAGLPSGERSGGRPTLGPLAGPEGGRLRDQAAEAAKALEQLNAAMRDFALTVDGMDPLLTEAERALAAWERQVSQAQKTVSESKAADAAKAAALAEIESLDKRARGYLALKDEMQKMDAAMQAEASRRKALAEYDKGMFEALATSRQKDAAAIEEWAAKQKKALMESITGLDDYEAKWAEGLAEIAEAQTRMADVLDLKNMNDDAGGLLSYYSSAADLVREWGETDKEYSDRVMAAKRELLPYLQNMAEAFEGMGATGEEGYQKITRALKELEEEQKKASATFDDGVLAGLKEYQDSLAMTYERGKSMSMEFARTVEDALVKAFDNPKEALKSLGDYFVSTLKRMIVQAAMNPITVSITAAMGGLMGSASNAFAGLNGSPGSPGLFGGSGFLGTGIQPGFNPNGFWAQGVDDFGYPTGMQFDVGNMQLGNFLGAGAGIVGVWQAYLNRDPLGGALSGAMAGMSLGGPIGAAIGAIVGAISGLIKGDPDLPEFALYANQDTGRPQGMSQDGDWTIYESGRFGFGMQELGLDEATMRNVVTMFERASDSVQDVLQEMGLSIEGFGKKFYASLGDIENMTAEQITARIEQMIGDYIESASGVDFSQFQRAGEEITDTIARVVAAMESFPDVLEGLDDLTASFADGGDAVNAYRRQIEQANESIEEQFEALDEITDPSDAIAAINTLQQAIVQRYQQEIALVQQLAQQIESVEAELAAFTTSMQQRIFQLTGDSAGYTASIGGSLGEATQNYNSAMGPGLGNMSLTQLNEAWGYLQQMIQLMGQFVQAQIEAIQAGYQAQMDALDAEREAIQENYELQRQALQERQEAINDEISALQKQIALAQRWKSVLDSVNDQILQMQGGLDNPAEATERLAAIRAEIERVQGLYSGSTGEEQAGYASQLQGLYAQYLGIAQEIWQRPSPEYQAIYNEVLGWLQQIKEDAEANSGSVESIQARIAELQEESNEINEQIKALNEEEAAALEAIDSQIAALQDAMAAEIAAVKENAAAWYLWAQTEGERLEEERLNRLNAQLTAIIGDTPLDVWLADAQARAVTAMEALSDWATAYWQNFRDALAGAASNPPSGTTEPPPGTTTEPTNPPGIFPWLNSTAGDSAGGGGVSVVNNITVQTTGDIDEEALARHIADVTRRTIALDALPGGRLHKTIARTARRA